jgi:hypothetical protein
VAVIVAVTFACGHRGHADGKTAPVCRLCGETLVSRCHAPAPRFVGHVRGPSATYRPDFGPITVTLGEKDTTHG